MRRLLTGLAVAATTMLMPALAFAGNQESADQIARKLRESGQLTHYKIGIQFQEGTAWLKGVVQSQEQMNAALKLVLQTSGVNRVVNNLRVNSAKPAAVSLSPKNTTLEFGKGQSGTVPAASRQLARVERVPSTFGLGPIQPVSATQRQPSAATKTAAIPRQALPMLTRSRATGQPIPVAYTQPVGPPPAAGMSGAPIPAYVSGVGGGVAPARYDQPHLPNYAWPSYAAYPNYAALTYPRQYSPTAWPFIGPFYPYPQVPLGWRKVTLEWDDGWWMLDFKDR